MSTGLYKLLGFVCVGVAVIGFILPGLPGTPFLLLAAWCFARSSKKWHQWLLQSQLLGPIIRNWEENKCISVRTKVLALTSIFLLGGSAAYFVFDNLWALSLVFLLLGVGSLSIISIRTCSKASS